MLVLEFISAGGLGEPPPASAGATLAGEPLLAQGARMRDALLAALQQLNGEACSAGASEDAALQVWLADAGLAPLPPAVADSPTLLRVTPGTDLIAWLGQRAADFDLVWAIAPETDRILERLCAAVPPARWIGCNAQAIRLCASKSATRAQLAAHGLWVPAAWQPGQPEPDRARRSARWVLKPDDGAGSEDTRVFDDFDAAAAALATAVAGGAAQTLEAWIEGEALSLSLLCTADGCEVLSVNRQQLAPGPDGRLVYAGVTVAIEPVSAQLQALARQVVAAVPGLHGFVGIDLVRSADGRHCVIEINPRLTCAYASLAARAGGGDGSGRNLAARIIAAHDARPLIGWDIGGAHVKASLLEHGRIRDIAQWPAPLWQGLHHLDQALAAARARWPQCAQAHHVVTMTAEMTDLFPDREAGVGALAAHLAAHLGADTRFYAGGAGWADARTAGAQWQHIASANWLASASLVGTQRADALLVDIGSTTTDLIPTRDGRPMPEGRSDAARLASGELVYLGVVRTPLCALARRIRFGTGRYNVMNEFFATTADVFRLSGELDPAHDQHPSADNGPRDEAGSALRLARLIGHDRRDAGAAEWRVFALRWRALMVAEIRRNLLRVIARSGLPAAAPIVGAGCGHFLARELAAQLGRPYLDFDRLASVEAGCADWARVCAPSVAVALLAARAAPAVQASTADPEALACSS